nr:E-beta-farnesene synthase [Tanacetum cinerariifolium]
MESLRESILERAKHKREKDKRMSDRMMQSKERKDNSSKALDVGLVVTESNETESKRHVLSSSSRNDTHTDDADINSVNDALETRNIDLEISVAVACSGRCTLGESGLEVRSITGVVMGGIANVSCWIVTDTIDSASVSVVVFSFSTLEGDPSSSDSMTLCRFGRPDSLLYLPYEEYILGYLKFSAKGTKREVFGMPIPNELITVDIQGEQYYKEYLEKVAKHQRYLASEEGSDLDSSTPKPAKATKKSKPSPPKAAPVTKLAAAQQPKPKPAPAKT